MHVSSLVVVVEVAAVVDDVVKFRVEILFKWHIAVVVVASVRSDVRLGMDRWWREGCSVMGAVQNFGLWNQLLCCLACSSTWNSRGIRLETKRSPMPGTDSAWES